MNIGNKIKRLRQSNSLTREQLAEKLNVHARTVQGWELDERMPNTTSRRKICDLFDITEAELLGSLENKPAPLTHPPSLDEVGLSAKDIKEIIERIDQLNPEKQKIVMDFLRILSTE